MTEEEKNETRTKIDEEAEVEEQAARSGRRDENSKDDDSADEGGDKRDKDAYRPGR